MKITKELITKLIKEEYAVVKEYEYGEEREGPPPKKIVFQWAGKTIETPFNHSTFENKSIKCDLNYTYEGKRKVRRGIWVKSSDIRRKEYQAGETESGSTKYRTRTTIVGVTFAFERDGQEKTFYLPLKSPTEPFENASFTLHKEVPKTEPEVKPSENLEENNMKITKSTLKQIIKEELSNMVSEAEEVSGQKFAVFAGALAAKSGNRPIERKLFNTKEDAEKFKQELSTTEPYRSGTSFKQGAKWELTVAPAQEKPSSAPVQKGPTDWWVSQGNRWFGPYENQTVASLSHDRGYLHEYPKGEKPQGA